MKNLDNYLDFIQENRLSPTKKTMSSAAGAGSGLIVASAAHGLMKKGGSEIFKKYTGKEMPSNVIKLINKGTMEVGKRATITGLGLYAGYRASKAIFDRCSRKCGAFKINTRKRQLCILNCKQDYVTKKINDREGKGKDASQLRVTLAKIIAHKKKDYNVREPKIENNK
jgi:hypothetical protein